MNLKLRLERHEWTTSESVKAGTFSHTRTSWHSAPFLVNLSDTPFKLLSIRYVCCYRRWPTGDQIVREGFGYTSEQMFTKGEAAELSWLEDVPWFATAVSTEITLDLETNGRRYRLGPIKLTDELLKRAPVTISNRLNSGEFWPVYLA